MPVKKRIFAIAAISSLVIFPLLMKQPAQEKVMAQSMPMNMPMDMMQMHMKTFGPADGYHVHKPINPDDYKKVENIGKKATDLPPPISRSDSRTVTINLKATEVVSEIVPVTWFHYWTFNDTVPGPFLRMRVGDTVELSLENDITSSHNHSIDLHAVTGPGGGAALTDVEPGQKKSIKFKVLNPGLFVYHCATPNAPTHMTNGMYGLILVEPEEGLAKVDREFYIMQGELYTSGMMGEMGFQGFDGKKMIEETPEYIFFNGRPWSLVESEGIMHANVGERVRLFVGNGGVSKVSSFHVIGEIFDQVYPEASTGRPLKNIQTTLIPAGGATITEFLLNTPGDYILVDHALSRIDRGAWGILKVNGHERDNILSKL
ncbi:MAG: copper-containing nitrite reductase [Gammaproteobacteria bacterium]